MRFLKIIIFKCLEIKKKSYHSGLLKVLSVFYEPDTVNMLMTSTTKHYNVAVFIFLYIKNSNDKNIL